MPLSPLDTHDVDCGASGSYLQAFKRAFPFLGLTTYGRLNLAHKPSHQRLMFSLLTPWIHCNNLIQPNRTDLLIRSFAWPRQDCRGGNPSFRPLHAGSRRPLEHNLVATSLPDGMQGRREQPTWCHTRWTWRALPPDAIASNQTVDRTTMSEQTPSEQSVPAAQVTAQHQWRVPFAFLSLDIMSIEEVDIRGLLNPGSEDRSSPDRQRDDVKQGNSCNL